MLRTANIGNSFNNTGVIPAKAGIHFDVEINGFPLSRE
jgi:hypothetical protein